MFNKYLSRAVSKDESRAFITYVYYDKEESSYVATDARLMLVEKTTDSYDSDVFLSPRTGIVEDVSLSFPDWEGVMPAKEDLVEIEQRTFKMLTKNYKPSKNNATVAIEGVPYDYNRTRTAVGFVGPDFKLFSVKVSSNLYLESSDGTRRAVLAPERCGLSEYSLSGEIDLNTLVFQIRKAQEFVAIALDGLGEIKGVFKSVAEAKKESPIVKVLPVL